MSNGAVNQRACVYILESQGKYKIGKAADFSTRLQSLQSGNPFELQVVLTIFTEQYDRLERALHAIYAAKRFRGEWFDLNLTDIEEIKSASVQDLLQRADNIKFSFRNERIETTADWPKYETWVTIKRPPRFICPLDTIDQVYSSDDTRKTLLASFTLIFSLGWEANYTQTPPLNEAELIEFLRLSRRTYFEHKLEMEQLDWFHSKHPSHGMVQFFFDYEIHIPEES